MLRPAAAAQVQAKVKNYDRLGRLSATVCNGMTDSLTYNFANLLLTESFTGGTLNGLSVTNGYDQFLRRTNLTALSPGVLSKTAYGYDNASRLASVTDAGNNSAGYSYVANSPLVGQITFKQSGATRMTTTKQYDYLNRLTQISSAPSGTGILPVSFNYNYNPANQTTNGNVAALVNASNGTLVANYEYGPFGEVIRANGPMAEVNPVRFSAKYQDNELDLLYYGYRYYKASTGAWLSRDPMEERGGLNLYAFINIVHYGFDIPLHGPVSTPGHDWTFIKGSTTVTLEACCCGVCTF